MLFLTTLTLALLPAVEPQTPQAPQLLAVRARTIYTGTGEVIENGTILIEGGTIRAVGAQLEIPVGAGVVDHDGVVTAGMIALHGAPGTRRRAASAGRTNNIFGEAEGVRIPKGPPPLHVAEEIEEQEVWIDAGEVFVEDPDDVRENDGHEHGGDAEGPNGEQPKAAVDPSYVDAYAAPYALSFAARTIDGDATRSMLPEGAIVYAFDPESSDFSKVAASGITTVVLTPNASGLVTGQTAAVKTAGGRVLSQRAQLSLSFKAGAFQSNRAPTSYSGALAELDERFDEPQGAFKAAASGELPVLFEVSTRADVVRAADFAQRHKLKGALNGARRAGEVAEVVQAAGLAVIVGPFGFGTPERSLRAVQALAEADVPFGFGLDAPLRSPEALRFGAALCVRQGLDRGVAWSALTNTAADIAGIGDRVGRIEQGLDADLVFWSGDPLDLASRVDAVVIDGEVAYRGGR